jgi:uncharacterized SAM-binding protein YcdF (DUF218 family)
MSLGPFAVALVVPPLNLLPLGLAGIALAWGRYRRLGLTLASLSLVGLLVLALPFTGGMLIVSLERNLPLTPPPDDPPRAIVVLAAEVEHGSPGMVAGENIDLGPLTLLRVRAGAELAHRSGLPLLVSGGRPPRGEAAIGALMAQSLSQDFAEPARWVEMNSEDTWENARDTAAILKAQGITSIYLVTNAWHMRRALIAFRHFGLRVTAAPTLIDQVPTGILSDLAPRVSGWMMSFYALHEWIGCLDYDLRR